MKAGILIVALFLLCVSASFGQEQKPHYASLIVGKWKFSQSGSASDQTGKDLKLFEEEYDCYDIFESNGRMQFSVGDCDNSEEKGTWSISGKILTLITSTFKASYEIVKLDKATLTLKLNNESDSGYYLLVFTKM